MLGWMAISRSGSLLCSFSLFMLLFSILAQARVPLSKQFKWVNQGEFTDGFAEYQSTYRKLPIDGISNFPFSLCFYNTTADKHVFGLLMGPEENDMPLWVWDANRNRPVRENATLSFGGDGNLILADADAHVVWQTNTSNKGVVGIAVLVSGNLVLHDKKGRPVWQSFDHPTDTLLVGQTLRLNGTRQLVSRTSDADGSDGLYSLAIAPDGVNMYLAHDGELLKYMSLFISQGVESVTLAWERGFYDSDAFYLRLKFVGGPYDDWTYDFVRLNYNATNSILRLGSDGSLKTFSYYQPLPFNAWWETFSLFSSVDYSYPDHSLRMDRACALPFKCGTFGFCEEGMCVACPTREGMLGWSRNCSAPKLPTDCKTGASVRYYKMEKTENFVVEINEGLKPVTLGECRNKCSNDCKCVGFFYDDFYRECWAVPVLGTLTKSLGLPIVAYIKY